MFKRIKNIKSIIPSESRLNLLLALACSGAGALIYEVVGNEILYFYFSSSFYSVATVLSVFLVGLGLGSMIIPRLFRGFDNRGLLFSLFQIAIGLYALLVIANFGVFPSIFNFLKDIIFSKGIISLSFIRFFSGFSFLFLPTFLLGGSFPLITSLFSEDKESLDMGIGLCYGMDLIGSVIGVILAGFLLIPVFGLKITLFAGVLLNLLAALLIALREGQKQISFLSLFLILAILLLSILPSLGKDVRKSHFVNGSQSFFKTGTSSKTNSSPGELVFSKSSPYGLVEVYENYGGPDQNYLKINGRGQCITGMDRSEGEISDITLSILSSKKKESFEILNIGLGCGVTLNNLLDSETTELVDVVEINPVVPEAVSYITDDNQNPLNDSRVNLVIEDGFSFVRRKDEQYDGIVMDIENPKVVHSSPLFTADFFETARKDLASDGVFSVWSFWDNYKFANHLYHTLKSEFNYVYLVKSDFGNSVLFFASQEKIDIMSQIMSEEDKKLTNKFLKEKNVEINTLNNPVLKSYFDVFEEQ